MSSVTVSYTCLTDAEIDSHTLPQVREAIDDLDKKLIVMLNERMRLSRQVGVIKSRATASTNTANSNNNNNNNNNNSLIYVPSREREIFAKIITLNQQQKGQLSDVAACAIWREIMSASISLQRRTVVAVAGSLGSFSHAAAARRFGASVDYITCEGDERGNSVNECWSAVSTGRAQYCVVPIHHSQTGTIAATLKLLASPSNSLKIYSELYVAIEYCLLSHGDFPLSSTTRVYGQPRALSACRYFISAFLPAHVELVCVGSITYATHMTKTTSTAVMIGAQVAAEACGLQLRGVNLSNKQSMRLVDDDSAPSSTTATTATTTTTTTATKVTSASSASSASSSSSSGVSASVVRDSWSSWDECVPSSSFDDEFSVSSNWVGAFSSSSDMGGVCRYLVLSTHCDLPTGDDRSFILFSVADQQGALHDALTAFSDNNVNLTQLESRAVQSSSSSLAASTSTSTLHGHVSRIFDYWFFVEIDGHVSDSTVSRAIDVLSKKCTSVKVLGSCPAAPNKPPYTPFRMNE